MNNNNFDDCSQNFVISFQLLQLLRWLFEHDQEALKKLIGRSLKNGLDEVLAQPGGRCESEEDLHHNIIEFFELMEALLFEQLHEDEAKRLKERVMIPAADQFDAAVCDDSLMAVSMERAAITIENNPFVDPKEVLCKELLKRWKPGKKLSMH